MAGRYDDWDKAAGHAWSAASATKEGFDEGLKAASDFLKKRAAEIREKGTGHVSDMMARIFEDEAKSILELRWRRDSTK